MKVAILHYSVAPVVGGVEAVVQAHSSLLLAAGHQVRLVAGAGEQSALPEGAEFVKIPEMDSRHPQVVAASQELEAGRIPADFKTLTSRIAESLSPAVAGMDRLIVHNVLTKHFNLPLTAAICDFLDQGKLKNCIAWCHDFTWTSPHSRSSVHPGYPWDLLRTYRQDVTYVTISQHRQRELAGLLGCPEEQIKVIYNGVEPAEIFSLSEEGQALIERLDLQESELILLMPVRITQAKNIEYALQVTKSLKEKGVHPKLVITGPPDPHDPEDMTYFRSLIDLRRKLDLETEARFIYESGPDSTTGYTIGLPVVREIYRVCDLLFMPSHREGFGMPILEAGMIGMPVFSTQVPAEQEIAAGEVVRFSEDDPPQKTAGVILEWAKASPTHRLRVRIRQQLTWQAIFQHEIEPLLTGGAAVELQH